MVWCVCDDLHWPEGLQEIQQLGPGLLGCAPVVGLIEEGENGVGHEWGAVRRRPGVGQLDVELRASRHYQGEADQLSAVTVETRELGIEVDPGEVHAVFTFRHS